MQDIQRCNQMETKNSSQSSTSQVWKTPQAMPRKLAGLFGISVQFFKGVMPYTIDVVYS